MTGVPGRERSHGTSAKAGQDPPSHGGESDLRPGTPATCTGPHCGREIRWVITLGDKRLPLDPDPSPDGNVVLERQPDGSIRARVLTGHELPAQGNAWVPHHRTCPDAADFRRRQAATAPRCRAGCGYPMDPWLAAHGWRYHVLCAPPTRAEIDAQRAYETQQRRRSA
jgi:hypothetical protein